jgi:cation transport ATPase
LVIGPRDVIAAIEDAGFEASAVPAAGAAAAGDAASDTAPLAREAAAWRARLAVAALLSAPVVALSMAGMVPAWMGALEAPLQLFGGLPWSWVVQGAFGTAVQAVSGAVFYRTAWKGLRRGEPNMQVGGEAGGILRLRLRLRPRPQLGVADGGVGSG